MKQEICQLIRVIVSGITYLSGYPSAVSVSGIKEFDYFAGDNIGSVTISGIPSGVELEMLAEYLKEYSVGKEDWYIDYAGKSQPFTVETDENTAVSINLVDANNGTINQTLPSSGYSYFLLVEENSFNSYVEISGTDITFDRNNDPDLVVVQETSATYPLELTAILPGRKMRIFARDFQWNGGGTSVAVSDSFEVLPGQTVTNTAINYYTFYC